MNNIKNTIANAKLLQKASAVKFGWLAMKSSGYWFWFSKKPKWGKEGYWYYKGFCVIAPVKFLKLPKRKSDFAPHSLIKCTARGAILLSTNQQFHRMWGLIDYKPTKSLKKLIKELSYDD